MEASSSDRGQPKTSISERSRYQICVGRKAAIGTHMTAEFSAWLTTISNMVQPNAYTFPYLEIYQVEELRHVPAMRRCTGEDLTDRHHKTIPPRQATQPAHPDPEPLFGCLPGFIATRKACVMVGLFAVRKQDLEIFARG